MFLLIKNYFFFLLTMKGNRSKTRGSSALYPEIAFCEVQSIGCDSLFFCLRVYKMSSNASDYAFRRVNVDAFDEVSF